MKSNFQTAQVVAKINQTVQVWYWPTLPQPYRVQTRLQRPGQPYRLHSAHDTQAEAEAEANRLALESFYEMEEIL